MDPEDRHVAAAAYKLSLDDWPGQKVALVTKNVKDFPIMAFDGTEINLYALGSYVDAMYRAEPKRVTRTAERCRRKLKAPPITREQYVAILMSHGCLQLAEGLSKLWSVERPKIAEDRTLVYELHSPSKKALKKGP